MYEDLDAPQSTN
jgi:hypothetical protein